MNSATKFVARQLQSLLGTYVDGVKEETLSLQLLGGKLKLENLRIRETAFAELELPLRASGRVGKLELSVNLLRFWWNEPVVIVLEDVHIELEPLPQGPELDPSDYEAHFERIRKWKDSQIRAIHEKQEDNQRNEDGFLARLARKVRDSLELRIRDFSIRFSDRRSNVSQSLVSLASNAKGAQQSSDDNVKAQKEERGTKKELKVEGLYFYIAPAGQDEDQPTEKAPTCRSSPSVGWQQYEKYIIVRPVNICAELMINDNHQFKIPEVQVNLNIDPLEWRFLRKQYIVFYKMIEEFSVYRSRLEHWHWRPRDPPLKLPLRWFQYAARCVREQVHHRRFAAKHGEKYVCLYKGHLLSHQSDEERREMHRLEKHMNADSVAACRSIAQQAAAAHEAAATEAKKEAASKRSWGQWAKSFVVSTAPDGVDVSNLDDESRRILQDALQSTGGDKTMESNAFPREFARYRFDFHVSMGSLMLAENGWGDHQDLEELCYMQIDVLDGYYEIRRDTYRYCFDIESFRMDNRQCSIEGLSSIASSRAVNDEAEGGKLLKWCWDTLPQSDREKDGGSITVVLNGLNLVYSWKQLVLGVYYFWFIPKSERFPVTPNRSADSKSLLERWADRTRYDKLMSWDIEVVKPCLLFPSDHLSQSEPVIILDFDRLRWYSESLEASEERKASENDSKYYDRNIMKLEGIRFRVAQNIAEWCHCSANSRLSWVMNEISIAENFGINFAWDICKLTDEVRDSMSFARHKVKVAVETVHFASTARQYNDFWYALFAVIRSHYVTTSESTPKVPHPEQKEKVVPCSPSFLFDLDIADLNYDMLEDCKNKNGFARLHFGGLSFHYENGSRARFQMKMTELFLDDTTCNESSLRFACSEDVSKNAAVDHSSRFVTIERGWNDPQLLDHPGHDQWWNFEFSTLILNWNDRTVLALKSFVGEAHGERKQPDPGGALQAEPVRSEGNPVTHQVESRPARPRLQVTASMHMLCATLMTHGSSISRLAMTAATWKYERGATRSSMKGSLGNFVVEDLVGPEGMFREKLGLRDKSRSVVDFEYCTYDSAEAGYPGYDAWLLLEMSSTRLIYSRAFIEALQGYIASEPLISGLMGKTASAVAESAKRAAGHHSQGQGLTKVKCRLVNPLVVLPVDESGAAEYLVADLGEIALENRFESEGSDRIEHFEAHIKSMNLKDFSDEFLMERVDFDLSGKRNIVNSGTRTSHINVKCDLSDVSLVCSDLQLRRIRKVFNNLNVSEIDSDSEGNHDPVNSGDDTDSDVFVDASDSEPWLRSIELHFDLTCTSLGMLCKKSEGHICHDLLRLSIRQIKTSFSRLKDSVRFEGNVLSVDVHDVFPPGKCDFPFLSSKSELNQDIEHVLKIKYFALSPEACNDDQEVDTVFELDFRTLLLCWNEKTVASIYAFFGVAFGETVASASPPIKKLQDKESVQNAPAIEGTVKEVERRRIQILCSVQMLSATLMKQGYPIARLDMAAATWKYERGATRSSMKGSLGNFVVEDLVGPEGPFREKLGLRDKSRSVVDFEYCTYDSAEAGYPGYDAWLLLEMSSTRLIYSRAFIEALQGYIASEPLISGLMGKTASAVAESAKRAAGHHSQGQGLTKVKCRLVNPLVVLPVDESGAAEYLVADLGEIALENRFESEGSDRIEHFEAHIKSMNLQDSKDFFVLENVYVNLTGHRTLDIPGCQKSAAQMTVKVSDVIMNASSFHALLLYKLVDQATSFPSDRNIRPQSDGARSRKSGQLGPFGGCFRSEISIHKVQLRVLLDVTESKEIAVLRLTNLDANYNLQDCKATSLFSIGAMDLEDLVSPVKRYLVSSKGDNDVDGKQLLTVQYELIRPNTTVDLGYDVWWDLRFQSLILNWNDKTVAALMLFVQEATRAGKSAECAGSSAALTRAVPATPVSPTSSNDSDRERSRTLLTMSMHMLSATLMTQGCPIASLAMTAVTWKYERGRAKSSMKGSLGNFVVEDLVGPEGPFREKLGLRDKSRSVVDFEYCTYDSAEAGYPGYDAWLLLEMSSTRLIYSRAFIEALQGYIASEPLISGLMGKTASAVAESAKRAAGHHSQGQGLTKVKCRLVNPLVVLPVDESGAAEYLVADLGEIALENRFESEGSDRIEHFEAHIKSMNLKDFSDEFLMERVDIDLRGHRILALSGASGALNCSTEVSDVSANFLQRQVVLLYEVLFRNFVEPLLSDSRGHTMRSSLPEARDACDSGSARKIAAVTTPMNTVDAKFTFSRIQLNLRELVDGTPQQQYSFSLFRPSLVFRRRVVETSAIFSILRLGISHGMENPGDPPPRLLLRYYEPDESAQASDRDRMPQLRLEYRCPADPIQPADLQLFLFRPEIVLLPRSLVDMHNYFASLAALLIGRFDEGRIYAALQSPTKRRPTGKFCDERAKSAESRPDTSVSIEVRKPRISFVESDSADSAKAVVQSTMVARGRLPVAGGGLELTGCSLASAEMFVSEDGSDHHMRSLVDPFDMVVDYAAPNVAAGTATAEGSPPVLARLSVATSSNVEAQISYNDCTFALALIQSWREALAGRRQRSGTRASSSEGSEDNGGPRDSPVSTVTQLTTTMEFRSGSIGVVLINDCFSNSHMPVLEIRGSTLSAFYGPVDEAGSVVCKVDAALEVDYFNMEVAAWEPFLEHWPIRIMRQSVPGGPVEWNLSATEPGNLNLTQAFAQCVALNRRTFMKALEAFEDPNQAQATAINVDPVLPISADIQETPDTQESTVSEGGGKGRVGRSRGRKITLLHPFHVRNETGVRVECSSVGGSSAAAAAAAEAAAADYLEHPPSSTASFPSSSVNTANAAGKFWAVVEPGACVPLDVRSSRRTQRKRLAQSQSMLLRVGDAWRPMAVRIDCVGAQNLALRPLDETRGVPCRVVCEVALVEGSRHILLRSSVQVLNRTLRPFSLLLEPDGILPADGSAIDLPPGAVAPIPVQMVAHCSLRIQPGPNRVWSQAIRLRQTPLESDGRPAAQHHLYRDLAPDVPDSADEEGDSVLVSASSAKGSASDALPFFAWIRVESPDGFRLEVTVSPILTLHNELAVPLSYHVVDGSGRSSDSRGRLDAGDRAEFHHFSPDEAAYLSIVLPGFRQSTVASNLRSARGEPARIQADRVINAEAELHREIICRDDVRDDLYLTVSVANVLGTGPVRPGGVGGLVGGFVGGSGSGGVTSRGKDRHVTLSCPFWIKNLTGLPLSFCMGSTQPGAENELVPALPSVPIPEVVQQVQQQLTSTVSSSLGMSNMPVMPRMPSVRDWTSSTFSSLVTTPRGTQGAHGYSASQGGAGMGAGVAFGSGGGRGFGGARHVEPDMAGQSAFHHAEQELGTLADGLTERPLRSAVEAEAAATAERDYPCLMFAFPPRMRRALFVRVAGSHWSRENPVSDGGASGVVEVPSPADRAVFQLALTRETRTGPHHRTEVLIFRPRFVLVNLSPRAVLYRQAGAAESLAVRLRSRHRTNFHWTDGGDTASPTDRALCLRLLDGPEGEGPFPPDGASGEWGWSGGIDISALGDTHVRLRALRPVGDIGVGAAAHRILRVEVRSMSDTLYVIIHPEAPTLPPYRIENHSPYSLLVRQADPEADGVGSSGSGGGGAADTIGAGECVPFAWDQPLLPPRLAVEVCGRPGACRIYDLDAIRDHESIRIGGGEALRVSVAAQGPTKVLRVSVQIFPGYKSQEGHTAAAVASAETARAAVTASGGNVGSAAVTGRPSREPRELSVTVSLDTVTVTVADLRPRELATVHLDGVTFRCSRVCTPKDDTRTFICRVATVQVDNMLHRTPYPVLLRSTAPTGPERPFLTLDAKEDLGDAAADGVAIIKSLVVGLADTELCLEGRITLLLYLYGLALRDLLASGQVGLIPGEAELFESSAARRRRIYFEQLLLPEVNVDFSFGRRELAAGDDIRAAAASQRLAWLAASVDHAQLTLSELRTGHVFVDTGTLGSVLLAHYQAEVRRQLLRVLGSVEILGNPVGLVRNLGTGFRALRSGIQEVARGGGDGGDPSMRPAVDGAKTMLKHGTHGLSNTISKVSSSMSRGVAALAFDDEFLKERETAKDDKGRAVSVRVGAAAGTDNVKRAIQSGISGLFRKPWEGYTSGGMKGMAYGVGLGVAGAICKPASGVLDLIANTTEGLSVQTNPTGKKQVNRRREPRDLESDRVLRPLHSSAPHLHSDLLRRLATQHARLAAEAAAAVGQGNAAGASATTAAGAGAGTGGGGVFGEDMRGDAYRSHVALPCGVLLLTDRHCVYAADSAQHPPADALSAIAAATAAGRELGWNAPLDAALVHRASLEWHVLWGDVGNVAVADGDVVLQAGTEAYAAWDIVIVPHCGPIADEVCQVVDDARRRIQAPSRTISRASSFTS